MRRATCSPSPARIRAIKQYFVVDGTAISRITIYLVFILPFLFLYCVNRARRRLQGNRLTTQLCSFLEIRCDMCTIICRSPPLHAQRQCRRSEFPSHHFLHAFFRKRGISETSVRLLIASRTSIKLISFELAFCSRSRFVRILATKLFEFCSGCGPCEKSNTILWQ